MRRVPALVAAAGCGFALRAVVPHGRTFAVAPRSGPAGSPRYGEATGEEAPRLENPVPEAVGASSAAVVTAVLSFAALRLAGSIRSTRRRSGLCESQQHTAVRAGQAGRSAVTRAAAPQDAPILRLGTRGSPLALAQAYETKRRLAEAFPELAPDHAVEIKTISTTGDERLDISLAAIGGKGLFTRELDVALMSKEVDFCVHSTKDVPTVLVPGTELCTMLPREDTRDVLISPAGITRFEDFPSGSVIGTASLRRQAQIYAKNPNVRCVNFRGNVQTRLRKLKDGEVSATLLAYAGLKRMSMESNATCILEWDQMLPAISQGAISFQCSSDDERTLKYLRPLSHLPTVQAVTCERAFLAALDGNCKTPIAGQARVIEGKLHFQGLVSSPDGRKIFRIQREGMAGDCEAVGRDAGAEIRAEAGEKFFQDMQEYVQEVAAANTKPTR